MGNDLLDPNSLVEMRGADSSRLMQDRRARFCSPLEECLICGVASSFVSSGSRTRDGCFGVV